ncbi:hypothetical protein BJV78DRAFT_1200666 [Lactifluus subvellereus]|nr:hypothetical protein BJV78DRAFT_1200666 [Lactifluus subvellereus]
MSSKGWTTVGNVANVEALAWTVVGSLATTAYQKSVTASDSILEECRKNLEEVKTHLNELTPERREEIRVLAEQEKCSSPEALDKELRSLSNDRCELSLRASQSSSWQRCMPLSQLRKDLRWLREAVLDLRNDTYKSTTFKKARSRAQAQRGHSEPSSPPHPSYSPADGMSIHFMLHALLMCLTILQGPESETTCTSGSYPDTGGRPEEYPLDVIHPAPAHTMTGHVATNLPVGFV